MLSREQASILQSGTLLRTSSGAVVAFIKAVGEKCLVRFTHNHKEFLAGSGGRYFYYELSLCHGEEQDTKNRREL